MDTSEHDRKSTSNSEIKKLSHTSSKIIGDVMVSMLASSVADRRF